MPPASAAIRSVDAFPSIPDPAQLADLRDALPARESIYQIFFPKEGRTLGLPRDASGKKRSDRDAWAMMGFEIDYQLTPDFYRLRDTRGALNGNPVEIWVNERKPADIVSRLAMAIPESGWSMGNIGIAGIDTIDEFEHQRKAGKLDGQFARIPLEKVMNTQLSRGAVCLLVPEAFNIRSLRELEGVDATAKYYAIARKFARDLERREGVSMRFIREAKGGTEDDVLLAGKRPSGNAYAFADFDFVQSGKSAVERKLRVAFMGAAKWDAIKNGEVRFDDMSLEEMKAERGVLFTSSGYLIRPEQRFTPAQETVGAEIIRRIRALIEGFGRKPVLYRPSKHRQAAESFRAGQSNAAIVQGYGRPSW